MGHELDDGAVGDELIDFNFRRRSVQSLIGTEGQNGDMQAVNGDAADAFGQYSDVTAANRKFFNGDERSGRCRVVIESQAFRNAAGEREVGSVKGAGLNLTVAGLAEVLKDLRLREGPEAARYQYDA